MPTPTRGFVDAYHQSRISHVAGTAYPAAIATPNVGLYLGRLPLSDGSGATDLVRTAVTWSALQQDPNTNRFYIQPTAPVSFTIPAAATGMVTGWGVYSAASGGTPVYVDQVPSPFQVSAGQVVTLAASTFRVWSEGTSTQA